MKCEDADKITLEWALSNCNMKSLEVKHSGDGWVGTKYILHTFNHGSSPECETLDMIRLWIIEKFKWRI
jgi:hypothetical protein